VLDALLRIAKSTVTVKQAQTFPLTLDFQLELNALFQPAAAYPIVSKDKYFDTRSGKGVPHVSLNYLIASASMQHDGSQRLLGRWTGVTSSRLKRASPSPFLQSWRLRLCGGWRCQSQRPSLTPHSSVSSTMGWKGVARRLAHPLSAPWRASALLAEIRSESRCF